MSEHLSHEPISSRADEAKVYLEIGPWYDPAVVDSSRVYDGQNVYVAIEKNEGDYHDPNMFDIQRQAVSGRRDKDNIMLTQGDALHMPYPDSTIHEVFMGNVLPAVPYEEIIPMLREAHRVMDGTGPLVMDIGDSDMETASDSYFNGEFFDDLTSAGFAVSAVLRSSGPDLDAWRKLRSAWHSTWPGDHVFVTAQKVDVPTQDSMSVQPVGTEKGSHDSIRVDSETRFLISHDYINSAYGVPEEVVDDVVAELFDTLEDRNIGLDDVLFSGYNGLEDNPDDIKIQTQDSLDVKDGKGAYFLSPSELFDADQPSGLNPIHFAGTGSAATIAAYDRRLLADLIKDPAIIEQSGAAGVQVNLTLEEMNRAKVLEFHPRYHAR